jgi:hypothetical protein
MGGMAAQIPIKDNPEANDKAMENVRQDKLPRSEPVMTELGSPTLPLHQLPPRSSTNTCPHPTNFTSAARRST